MDIKEICRLVLRSKVMGLDVAVRELTEICKASDNSSAYHLRAPLFNQLQPARFQTTKRLS